MGITNRRYKLLGDFNYVGDFLDAQYEMGTINGHLIRPFWEYAHTHPAFRHNLTHRFGLWENDQVLVGIACYETNLGECLLSVNHSYLSLLPEMLEYAERELSSEEDGLRTLGVWITENETDKIELLIKNGYKKIDTDQVKIFSYDMKFPETLLPDGFEMTSLADENNIKEINACLWKGFDHGDKPDDDYDCRLQMQSGPNFSKELTTIIKAPNGEYACFAGMWYNEENKYAYLEPLATIPKYRKMGLAKVALIEGMKKTKALGAKYCYGGSGTFYDKVGFTLLTERELWTKSWSEK